MLLAVQYVLAEPVDDVNQLKHAAELPINGPDFNALAGTVEFAVFADSEGIHSSAPCCAAYSSYESTQQPISCPAQVCLPKPHSDCRRSFLFLPASTVRAVITVEVGHFCVEHVLSPCYANHRLERLICGRRPTLGFLGRRVCAWDTHRDQKARHLCRAFLSSMDPLARIYANTKERASDTIRTV